MFTVEQCIRELLFEQECVIIPDFGGFLTKYKSAVIEQFSYNIYPPVKTVSFNRQLKSDDGLLINTYAVLNGLTFQEASKDVRAWVTQFESDLLKNKSNDLPEIGSFKHTDSGEIIFEFDKKQNFHADTYGLAVVIARPVEKAVISEISSLKAESQFVHEEMNELEPSLQDEPAFETAAIEAESKSTFVWSNMIIAVLVMGAIASAVLPFFDVTIPGMKLNEAGIYSVLKDIFAAETASEIEPISVKQPAVYSQDVSTNHIQPETEANIEKTSGNISSSESENLSFMVVAGVFKEERNAERFHNTLSASNFNQQPLKIKRGRVFYVGFNGGENASDAQKLKRDILSSNVECWVKKW